MTEKTPRKESLVEIVGLPTLAAGAGSLIGGVAGGTLTRTVLDSPGVRKWLSNLSKADLQKTVQTLQSLGAGAAGTASAVGSYALSEYIRDRIDRRRELERRSGK
jgi:hypothetical protein